MKRITIGNLPGLSLKEIGSMYLSSFGIIWLGLEPLGAFGILQSEMTGLGWVGYSLLAIVSLAVAVPLSQIWRRVKFSQQEFINVVVESSSEGISYDVKAPANLQVWDFSHLFVEHLEKGPASERIKAINRLHTPVLNLKKNNETIELDNSITIKEIGIDGTGVLFVSGEPIEVDIRPRYSRRAN